MGSDIRILCATNAMGLGMNIIDIKIVIQWKQPPSIQAPVQRAGRRAARGTGRVGKFIWFHLVWCKSERAPPPTQRPGDSRLREVMGINDVEDKMDSEESEIDKEKKTTRAKKKAINKKTLVEQQAWLDNYL